MTTMWHHYCKAEKGWLMVGKGEPCNWCPAEPPAVAEDDSKKETEKCQTSPSAD
jgi:hypothetical protein